jgi:hypothetical protein
VAIQQVMMDRKNIYLKKVIKIQAVLLFNEWQIRHSAALSECFNKFKAILITKINVVHGTLFICMFYLGV